MKLAARTGAIYQEKALAWDAQRPRHLMEQAWLDQMAAYMEPGASVLDLGCGAGEPIAAYLIGRGLEVTGADIAPAMLEIAAARFPERRWVQADMRHLDLGRTFDAVVAWDSFFHLTRDEQRRTIPLIAAHLAPGGVLLVTTGPEAGEVTGHVDGAEVYHASLSPEEYRLRFADAGLSVLDFCAEDPECGAHTVWLVGRE